MSRWDALKPESDRNQKRGNRKPGINRRSNKEFCDEPASGNNTARCALDRYGSLRDKCRASPDNAEAIVSLAKILSTSIQTLPVEIVACETVHEILLPHLEDTASPARSQREVLRALECLLKDSKHASAIMAPLVEEVTDEGKEYQLANPIRCRMFMALQQKLLSPCDKSVTEASCMTLVTGLEAAHMIDGTKHHAGMSKLDIDVSCVQSFIQDSLSRNNDVRWSEISALQLLRSLLRRHPEAAPSLAVPLLADPLGNGGAYLSKCPCCGFHATCDFLNLMHSLHNHQESSLAMECTVELINNLPLDLWMRRTTRSISSFQDRIVRGLDGIIRLVRCRVAQLDNKHIGSSVSSLAKCILLKLPYEQDPSLQSSSYELVASLIQSVGATEQGQRSRREAVDILIDCAGGRMTPQGKLTQMSLPLRAWLSSGTGGLAVKKLSSCVSMSPDGSEPVARLLRAFSRTYPGVVLDADENWKSYQACVKELVTSSEKSLQLTGMQMIEGMLRGRKDFLGEVVTASSDAVMKFVSPLLRVTICEGSPSCVRVAVVGYGCLLDSDWDNLDESESMLHIRPILSLCLDKETAVHVRSESCKSVGDICTEFFSARRSKTKAFDTVCREVCLMALQAAHDSDAPVRGMALFAMGNLAQTLKHPTVPKLLDSVLLVKVAECVSDCFGDSDEKVVGNAIRSAGHVGGLLIREDYDISDTEFNTSVYLNHIILWLSRKVRGALSLPLGDDGKKLSWRQRSVAKKHSWGACNALAMLFEAGVASNDTLRDACASALTALIECIETMEVLNEKVFISASASIRTVDCQSLSLLGPQIGTCLVVCVSFLLNQGFVSGSKRLREEVKLLLRHLLHSCSIRDTTTFIQSKRISASELSRLYEWMVEEECSPHTFDRFALAMQKNSVSVDVDIELRFSNQALRLQKGDLGEEL